MKPDGEHENCPLVLSKALSFRKYKGFTVAIDHANKLVLRLNESAGVLLEKIDNTSPPLSISAFNQDEQAFLSSLNELGFFSNKQAKRKAMPQNDGAPARRVIDFLGDYADEALFPLFVQWELTYRCPLQCKHCYLQKTNPQFQKELTTDEISETLGKLAEMGAFFLLFTGGEPLLRDDFLEIFRQARKRRFAVSILSSGYPADDTLWQTLKREGVDKVQISLHAAQKEIHEKLTGVDGSYEKALASIRTCKDLGIDVRAAVSVTKFNAPFLPELVAFAQKEGFAINANMLMTPVRGETKRNPTQLEPHEMEDIITHLPNAPNCKMATKSQSDAPCTAGRSTLAITPTGEVSPCLMMPLHAGNIRQSNILDIWRNAEIFQQLRSVAVEDLQDWAACELHDSCNRCAGLAVMEGKSIFSHSELDCMKARVIKSTK